MKPLLIFLPLLLDGCGDGATVLLVRPTTGEQITCRGYVPYLIPFKPLPAPLDMKRWVLFALRTLHLSKKEEIAKPTEQEMKP